MAYLAMINICTLPYSFWSIWYQRFRAKQWCPLCLIIQSLLWVLFFFDLLGGYISFTEISAPNIIVISCIYLIPFLAINIIISHISASRQIENIKQELNSIKASDEIFLALLKQQPYFKTDHNVSKILFGNINAKNLITILTNPHCNPCAKMHQDINQLLVQVGHKVCVQYIFTPFGGLEDSALHLISCYYNSKEQRNKIFSNWFHIGRNSKNSFFEKYNYPIDSDIREEYKLHERWCNQTGFRATPTVLYNGYKLPDYYDIKDLLYFVDLDVDSK